MEEMRNSLNVEEALQIKKKAKREAIKWTLALGFIIEIIITAMLINDDTASNIRKIIVLAIMQIIIILFGYLMFYLIYPFILDQKKAKIYAALAEGCLSKTEWTQVVPIKADEYEKFILEELPTRANFFAKLREDSDIIDVFLQFHNEREYLHWEGRGKTYFLDYYSILEEGEKEPEEKSND